MPDLQTTEPGSKSTWIRGHVMTRFFAGVWWVVVLLLTVCLAVALAHVAVERSWRSVVAAAIVGAIFIPIGREWPNASRMWRMLRHGT